MPCVPENVARRVATPQHFTARQSPAIPRQLRMDFGSITVGVFVYHCHLIGHEDNGMMAKIQVRAAV